MAAVSDRLSQLQEAHVGPKEPADWALLCGALVCLRYVREIDDPEAVQVAAGAFARHNNISQRRALFVLELLASELGVDLSPEEPKR